MILLRAHIEGLRRHPWTSDAWVILFAELNTGHESGHLAGVIAEFTRTACYVEPQTAAHAKKIRPGSAHADAELIAEYRRKALKNPGFNTDQRFKNEIRVALRGALMKDRLRYLEGCVSANPFLQRMRPAERFLAQKRKLEQQLSRSRVVVKEPVFDTAPPKISWSGKSNAEGVRQAGYNDDLAVMLAAGVTLWDQTMEGELAGFPYDLVRLRVSDDPEAEREYRRIFKRRKY